MESTFYKENRETLYNSLPDGTMLVTYSGSYLIKTADEPYPFFANRNYVYLTGIDYVGHILTAVKIDGKVTEKTFIPPKDAYAERWTGRRLSAQEVTDISGMVNIADTGAFDAYFQRMINTSKITNIAGDYYKNSMDDRDNDDIAFAKKIREVYPQFNFIDIMPQMKKQRVIKKPCEIAAMKKAEEVTRDGIVAMMKASKPGMHEYEYRAIYDYVLRKNGMMEPGFPSIISAGKNNFTIHYYGYDGVAQDGDMILNDVGARYDYMGTDVSRGWPCNGKFTERQRQIYTCIYNTSEYMFSVVKPGMPMHRIDEMIREYCFEQLKGIGMIDDFKDIGKYMWHGGAHHVGFDTHDLVSVETTAPGMVFCIDIGVYNEEWGIGFRLEDNCLVTEDGCENLSICVPKKLEEVEAIMAGK